MRDPKIQSAGIKEVQRHYLFLSSFIREFLFAMFYKLFRDSLSQPFVYSSNPIFVIITLRTFLLLFYIFGGRNVTLPYKDSAGYGIEAMQNKAQQKSGFAFTLLSFCSMALNKGDKPF